MATEERQQSYEPNAAITLVSILFIVLGILAFIFLISTIASNDDFQSAFENTVSFEASGLPDGVEIDPESGLISGQLEADSGVYRVTVTTLDSDPDTDDPFVVFNWAVGEITPAQAALLNPNNDTVVEIGTVSIQNPGDQINETGERIQLPIEARDSQSARFNNVILKFLLNFGIVVPLLLIGVAFYTIRMGILLYRRTMSTAMWARQLLMWLMIASFIGLISGIVNAGSNPGGLIVSVTPWVFGMGVSFIAMRWLGNNMHLFYGTETLSSRQARTAWNLLVPTIVILILVALQPLEQTFIASLTNERFASSEEPEFVGFDNYFQLLGLRVDSFPCENDPAIQGCTRDGEITSPRRYFIDSIENYRDWGYTPLNEYHILGNTYIISARDSDFINSIGDTLQFTIISVTAELILGIFIAMVVNSRFSGRGLMRTAMLVPWAIPTVISARLWEVMLRDSQAGVLNKVLLSTGLIDAPQSWLTSPDTQIWSMVFVDVWKTAPFMALLLLAGLQTISAEVYEAADVDGASKVRQFFSITLPLLRPTIAVALVFRTLDAVRVFDLFQVLLGGRRYSMATYNFTVLVERQEFGYASTVGVVIFVIILLFTVAYIRILGVEAE